MSPFEVAALLGVHKREALESGENRLVRIDDQVVAHIEVVDARDRELEASEAHRDQVEVWEPVAFVRLTIAGERMVRLPWGMRK